MCSITCFLVFAFSSDFFFGFMAIAKAIFMMPVCGTPYAGKEFHCILEVFLVTNTYFYHRTPVDDYIYPVIFQISIDMSL